MSTRPSEGILRRPPYASLRFAKLRFNRLETKQKLLGANARQGKGGANVPLEKLHDNWRS